jgi:UDP-2,3-diacylglucosamine hydrolase
MSRPDATSVAAYFISDLHLQASHPATSRAFFDFLAHQAVHAKALYLLGDLFEYWAGDDDLADPFNAAVADGLRAVSNAGVAVYWIAGNRDFLVGQGFARVAGVTLLDEPHVVSIADTQVTLVHGDAECTGDTAYMAFRQQVRDPAWQAQFLAMPLSQRKAIIAGLREGSRDAHAGKSMEIMDVTPAAIAALHEASASDIIIHGHTHRPALHVDGERRRYVLPDWEPDAEPPRGGWISIGADGVVRRHDLRGTVLA